MKNSEQHRKEKTYHIRNVAEKFGIALIYIFGSQSKNGKRYLQGNSINIEDFSDLDLAVSFKNIPSAPMKIYGDLYKELSEIFEPFHIDLIFMHEVDVLFQSEIIKGIKIFEKDPFLADEFEEMVMKKAEDLTFKKKIMNREILEAIEDGYIEFEYRADS